MAVLLGGPFDGEIAPYDDGRPIIMIPLPPSDVELAELRMPPRNVIPPMKIRKVEYHLLDRRHGTLRYLYEGYQNGR